MKKSKALFLLAASLLIGCANQPGGDVPSTDSSSVAADIRFSASEFEVRSGTCLTVEGAPQGVTYSFQGGTPDGVSLDANTGLISFDEEGIETLNADNDLLLGYYIALAGTIVHQNFNEILNERNKEYALF